MSIRMYVVLAVSVLRFVMQFYPVSKEVLRCEGSLQQKLLAGPRFSFNRVMCTRMRDLGLPIALPDVANVGIAPQVRLDHSSAVLGKLRMLLSSLLLQDDLHPARALSPWWPTTRVRSMVSTWEEHIAVRG
eukprot:8035813-Pyramimonas_sp.AAC.1